MNDIFEYITDLLTDFDEMGFAPTTAVPDPEAYAIKWREKITKAIEELSRVVDANSATPTSEWISVEDRLPTTYQDVLCYDGHNYYVDFIRLDGTWCDADLHHFEITHWMPLPEAPKGGAE